MKVAALCGVLCAAREGVLSLRKERPRTPH